MTIEFCPFCNFEADRCFFASDLVFGLWDAYPVSPGHALLIPRRHVASWFEATSEEQRSLLDAIEVTKLAIEKKHRPDGYNIGINVSAAAGQTVFHLHVHVIPRYLGDVPDPRGGVRHVIPAKGNYLTSADTVLVQNGRLPHLRELVTGGEDDPLLAHLVPQLAEARNVDIAVAFAMDSGVRMLWEHLRDVLDRGGRVRIVTGDYMGVTQPEALLKLLDLQGDMHLRVFESGNTSFHPKAYIVIDGNESGTAFVGSSNLSRSALQSGVEWNYRVIAAQQYQGFAAVTAAFEELFSDARTRPIDAEWIRHYAQTRVPLPPSTTGIDEPIGPIPVAHGIQREALQALDETRQAGNVAGLVVLATGLGKTWLSAFDSNKAEFRRVLFVAHREEILAQAMRTFRAIRPTATIGYYTGKEKTPATDVLFASIQTIGRQHHMLRFGPKEFDYVIVDEFHHASANTYRRLIGYLEPKFLLGLTATPERTDGADLLSLCGDNLVYRRDVVDGIRAGLLCPYAYFGVPDDINYDNIPWRSGRFDEDALTNSVATKVRAQNALEQLQLHGGTHTIGFCVSQRHSDFMAGYFRNAGLRAVAVHAGPSSAPRALSLEQLQDGALDIVFAVDMFNEGVDLPDVDSILMLRPTESRILWLQQFGRGLRQRTGKTLKVVDYIGNHRVFLNKARALFNLGDSNRDLVYALELYEKGDLDLPPGCSVTYDLEAIRILRGLIQPRAGVESLKSYYEEFRDRVGLRPAALEAYQDGYNPSSAREHHGSWLGFVHDMDGFTPDQKQAWQTLGTFLSQIEITPMTKSYKMILLLAVLGEDAFPGYVSIARLTERFGDLARKYALVRTEVGDAIESPADMRRLLLENPINAFVGGQGMGGISYFTYDGEQFGTSANLEVPAVLREAAQDLLREVAEWRLTAYLRRAKVGQSADRVVCKVSHSGGRPILFLPDRNKQAGIPDGWQDITVDNESLQAKFAKIAVNVIARPGSEENLMPQILRRWFGEDAGQPGRSDHVAFLRHEDRFALAPLTDEPKLTGPVLWQRYARADAPKSLGFEFRGREAQSGIFQRPGAILLFVTLEKATLPEAHRYEDKFLSPTEFQWQSQNRTTQASTLGLDLSEHQDRRIEVHLFVRRQQKSAGRTQLFIYCGRVQFERWEGEKPITVWWKLAESVPSALLDELKIGKQAT